MKSKKTNIKIKRHKYNLYNKKKNKTKRVLTAIVTVIAVCGLGVLGYGLGKPIVNYFQNREQYTSDPSSAWSPPSDSDISENSANSGDPNVSSEEPNSTPVEATDPKIYFLPENAAVSSASLNSALAAAKESGCDTVAVTLKDKKGSFLYKSDIEGIKDGDTTIGAMTARQICEAITAAGLTPAAKISTLMDCSSPRLVAGGYELAGGNGYWLDATPANGGKQWLSPFKSETVKFIGDITSELSAAGFKHIICADTRFPAFYNSDINKYLSNLPLTDSDKRSAALWDVVSSARAGCEKNGAVMWLQISGESISAEKKDSTDAEITKSADKIKDERIIVSYTGASGDAAEFAQQISAAANGAKVAVSVKASSSSAVDNARKVFENAGFDVFVES